MFDPTELLPRDLQLAEAWRAAAAELGLRITAPFELPVGGRVFRYAVLVAGFGTASGVVIRALPGQWHPDQCGAIWAEATAAGYCAANLSLVKDDREEIASFLNMFEWCGSSEERPGWHSGPANEGRQSSA